jgi:hypothetical protein
VADLLVLIPLGLSALLGAVIGWMVRDYRAETEQWAREEGDGG